MKVKLIPTMSLAEEPLCWVGAPFKTWDSTACSRHYKLIIGP